MKLADTGLRRQPFQPNGTPSLLVPYASQKAAIRFLNETRCNRRGLGLFHGPPLSGKTSIIRQFTASLPDDYAVAVVDGAGMSASALLQDILAQFGYGIGLESANERFSMVRVVAMQQTSSGQAPLLVVENAHAANPMTLEMLCELAELAVDGNSALRMILVSDRPMLPIVQAPAMQSISNRLTGKFLLQPLTRQETTNYVYRKLLSGGCKTPQAVVPQAVCDRLHMASGGWPGIIDRLAVLAISRAERCPLHVSHIPLRPATKAKAVESATSVPELILTCRRRTLARTKLDRPRLIIGRDEASGLRVIDDFVSRQHAVLLRNGGATIIVDLNSKNGTCVNGKRVKKQVLINNDIVSLGDHRLKFVDASARRRTTTRDAGWDDTAIAKSLGRFRNVIARQLKHNSAS